MFGYYFPESTPYYFCLKGTDPNSDPWDNVKSRTSNPAFDWIRGAYGSKSSTNQIFRSLEEEVAYLRAQRIGDGNSSGKLSDSDCGNIPYEVLIQDLTQAKRQLLELHSLVRDPTLTWFTGLRINKLLINAFLEKSFCTLNYHFQLAPKESFPLISTKKICMVI
jgi:hypothetical protein